MATNYWLKLYHDIIRDHKIGRLPVNLKWRFVECLVLAGEVHEDGYLPPVEQMAWELRCDEVTLKSDLGQLAMAELLEIRQWDDVTERWFVSNFSKRQAPSDAALRMREYRKKKRKEKKKEEITDTDNIPSSTQDEHRNMDSVSGSGAFPFIASPVKSKVKPECESRIEALAAVCCLDLRVGSIKRQVEQTAVELADYQPDYIQQRYGDRQGGWWWLYDFRGRRGDVPTLRNVKETICLPDRQSVSNGRTNGHAGHNQPEIIPDENGVY